MFLSISREPSTWQGGLCEREQTVWGARPRPKGSLAPGLRAQNLRLSFSPPRVTRIWKLKQRTKRTATPARCAQLACGHSAGLQLLPPNLLPKSIPCSSVQLPKGFRSVHPVRSKVPLPNSTCSSPPLQAPPAAGDPGPSLGSPDQTSQGPRFNTHS